MRRWIVLLIALVVAWNISTALFAEPSDGTARPKQAGVDAKKSRDDAILAVRKLGSTFEYDETRRKPLVLRLGQQPDAVLAHLKAIPSLEKIRGFKSKLNGSGFEHLNGHPNLLVLARQFPAGTACPTGLCFRHTRLIKQSAGRAIGIGSSE